MTLMRPRTTGRVLRGSALGLGLLVVGGVSAPAALAAVDNTDGNQVPADGAGSPAALNESPAQESPAQESPAAETAALAPALQGDFGSGKDFTVHVDPYGPVPDDLDLSGAVFRATPVPAPAADAPVTLAGDPEGYTCTTDAQGTCTFDGPQRHFSFWDIFGFTGSDLLGGPDGTAAPRDLMTEGVDVQLPVGHYVLTQEVSTPGLAPATGSATFDVCGTGGPSCSDADNVLDGYVGVDSLFRTSLVTTVTDVDSGQPLACAGYELTGPDYPHDGSQDPADPVVGTVPAECVEPTTAPTTTAPITTTAPTTSTAAPGTSTDSGSSSSTSTTSTGSSTSAADTSTSESSPATTTSAQTVGLGAPALALAAVDASLVTFGTQVSDGTGTMTFPGWFLPGDGYLLTPTTTPAGYAPDVTDGFTITTTPQQAAARQPAAVARALATGLASGAPAPATTTGPAGAAAATTTGAAAVTTAATTAEQAALATTGTPVGTMVLLGGGLVALGGGALATGSVLRRRARSNA